MNMSTQYIAAPHVECTYYRKESTTNIRCAGLIGEHTTTIFASEDDKKTYKVKYCRGNCEDCLLYRELENEKR